MNVILNGEYLKVVEQLKIKETQDLLIVSIKQQRLYHQKEGKSVKTYVASTSLKTPSCKEDSLGTPWGLHEVCEVIGAKQPLGMVFQGRMPIGLHYWDCEEAMQQKNLITSRILRLNGLQEGLNRGGKQDTFNRFVYLHGTNHEDRLGKPASSGCIQLGNQEVIELANKIGIGSHLYISLN
jgi:hypothetical protein